MKTKKSVLIIKLGYCETLANEKGFIPSLGDVFRHTVLLHHYKEYNVTWLTSKAAYPLLENNPYIHKLLAFENRENQNTLKNKQFDEIVCLEKAPSVCALAKSLKCGKHFGFGWNGKETHAHPMAENALEIANGKSQSGYIQDILYKIIGAAWNGEDYILGYTPKTRPVSDIGLNYLVGSKWPSKVWPTSNWHTLQEMCLKQGWSVTWQQGKKDLYEYMDWINSARILVTCDSLGMHLGLALKKKVIALFGPTPSNQIYMYNRGLILRGGLNCPKAPCMLDHCVNNKHCMEDISPEHVVSAITRLQKTSRAKNIQVNECLFSEPAISGAERLPC